MPRQLPWKTGGGRSRTQTIKPSTRQLKTAKTPDEIDNNFFGRYEIASNSNGTDKAKAASASDESLPASLTPRSKRTKDIAIDPRAASSSPPPLVEDALTNEPMRKGVSKFDLRDDEWMMVEDEFLETAKLFTRHLHIAEYVRLKEAIEAKKKEVDISRPVVAGMKRSEESAMKERAKVQDSRQKKAIRDVFASLGDDSADDSADRVKLSRISSKAKPRTAMSLFLDTDSDDLDATHPAKPKPSSPAPEPLAKVYTPPPSAPTIAPSSFAKPALPPSAAVAKPRARPIRKTPFDMLDDDYTPPPSTSRPPPATTPYGAPLSQSRSPHSTPQTSQPAKTSNFRRSSDLINDQGSSNGDDSGVRQEIADRIAKRKAERARESDAEKKSSITRLDDIPTFLF